jgi:hypothetical protein
MVRNQPTNTSRMTSSNRLSSVTESAPCSCQKFGDIDEDNAHHHHLGVMQAENSTTSTKCKIENSKNHSNACMC